MKSKLLFVMALIASSATYAQVGIGNSNPQYPLDMNGRFRIRTDSTLQQAPGILFNKYDNTLGSYFGYHNDTVMTLSSNTNISNAEYASFIFDYKNRRLGITNIPGYSSLPGSYLPKYPLHIRTSDTLGFMMDYTSPSGSGPGSSDGKGPGMIMRTGGNYTAAIRTINLPTTGSRFGIFTGFTSSLGFLTENFSILSSGLVGIGQQAPMARLHVTHDDTALAILENADAITAGAKTLLYFKNADYYTGIIGSRATAIGFAGLSFSTYASHIASAMKERMFIADNGYVGINVSAPTAFLDVDSTVRFRKGGGAGKVLTSDANGNASWQAPVNIGFNTGFFTNQFITVADGETLIPFLDNANLTKNFDDGGNFNNTTHTFVVPVTGMYHFDIRIGVNTDPSTSGQINLSVKKLPYAILAEVPETIPAYNSNHNLSMSFNIRLNAGDEIGVYFQNFTGSTTAEIWGSPTECMFGGYRVY